MGSSSIAIGSGMALYPGLQHQQQVYDPIRGVYVQNVPQMAGVDGMSNMLVQIGGTTYMVNTPGAHGLMYGNQQQQPNVMGAFQAPQALATDPSGTSQQYVVLNQDVRQYSGQLVMQVQGVPQHAQHMVANPGAPYNTQYGDGVSTTLQAVTDTNTGHTYYILANNNASTSTAAHALPGMNAAQTVHALTDGSIYMGSSVAAPSHAPQGITLGNTQALYVQQQQQQPQQHVPMLAADLSLQMAQGNSGQVGAAMQGNNDETLTHLLRRLGLQE